MQKAYSRNTNGEFMDKMRELELAGYNVPKTVRIDEEMEKELRKIAIYEKKKLGTLLRDWMHEKIRTYRRNPDYKRWLKMLEASR